MTGGIGNIGSSGGSKCGWSTKNNNLRGNERHKGNDDKK